MKLHRVVLIGSAALALVLSTAVTAGKGGGGQGGMGSMGADAPKPMSQERVRVEGGEQKGELVRERHEGELQAGGQGGSGKLKGDLETNSRGKDR